MTMTLPRELRATTCGEEMHALAARLLPICRSLTGDGVRETLAIIKRDIVSDLVMHEVPSGTKCFVSVLAARTLVESLTKEFAADNRFALVG